MKNVFTAIAAFGLLLYVAGPSEALADEPPCSTEVYHQFDFWIGKWAVETPDGKPAGDSQIQRVQDGCIILENWQSLTSPYTGTSVNFYDPDIQQWRQIWLDNQGGKLELFGNRIDNQMILRSKTTDEGVYQQITWTANEDGSVRQFWQTFTTGEEPKTLFDGKYNRDEPAEDWTCDS
ncbi:MAG TPA: hypothetical protein DCW52_04105 [Gammaproteobacteria bacterium]|nr:hypothetical protein [Gammaproteobacteria bacterium]